MRKIQNYLDSKGLIQIVQGNRVIAQTNELSQVYDKSVNADYILVHSGVYDLGNNSIQFRNGVDWHFAPNVTISSDSANGTFKDNGVNVSLSFSGNPNIINTNGFDKRFVMSSASYSIKDFFDEGIYRITEYNRQTPASASTINILSTLKSSLPSVSIAYDDPNDVYGLKFSDLIADSPTRITTEVSVIVDDEDSGFNHIFRANIDNGLFFPGSTFINFQTWGVYGMLKLFILTVRVYYKK